MSGEPTILVVDDNPMVRDVVQGILTVAGYHAIVAPNGIAALVMYEKETVDAAIIDVDMPGPSGIEVCSRMRAAAAARGQPLLAWIMTGVVRPELVTAAQAAGALGILAKPFTRAELLGCFDMLASRLTKHALAS